VLCPKPEARIPYPLLHEEVTEVLPTSCRIKLSARIAAFEFKERSQYFIGAHNETLSVAVRVNNPDCAPSMLTLLTGCSRRFAMRTCSPQAVRSSSAREPMKPRAPFCTFTKSDRAKIIAPSL